MSLLEVKNVKKIYTTRFGSNQVEALRDVVTDPYIAAYYIMYLVDNPDVNIAIGKAANK